MERMEKQTVVNWLVSELMSKGIINADGWVWDDDVSIVEIIQQAKEMEKQQLGKFYNHGQWTTVHGDTFEEHYNKTFKSE